MNIRQRLFNNQIKKRNKFCSPDFAMSNQPGGKDKNIGQYGGLECEQ